jgi:hypothetical protein
MAIQYKMRMLTKDCMHIIASGKDESLDEVKQYTEKIVEFAIENKPKYILSDERNLIYDLSILDTYELGEFASKYASHINRVAIVCNTKYYDSGNFYETVSRNRGLTINVMTNMKEAMKWLGLTAEEYPEVLA